MDARNSKDAVPLEIELKLALDPRSHAALVADPSFAHRRGERSTLHTIYFDTPSCALWRAGIALRVRRNGRRWTQTVKGAGRVSAGLHERIEIETRIPDARPRLEALPDAPLAAEVRAAIAQEALEPVFVTRFTRIAFDLSPEPGVHVEASIDDGHVQSGARRARLCELELELKSGPPNALYAVARDLAERHALRVDNRSKAERGYALYRGDEQRPVKANPIALDAALSARRAFHVIVASILAHLQANEDGLLHASDSEYLHQMRVALRRLRSAFSVFAPLASRNADLALVAEMKWLANALGPARDWDVYMETLWPSIQARFAENAAVAQWAQRFERTRTLARRAAQAAVASPRYTGFLLALGAWLATPASDADAAEATLAAQPIGELAAAVLAAQHKRVRKRGRRLAHRSPEELHRLRIAVKKLRYALSFFADLYPAKTAQGMLDALAGLQDALGTLNDAAVVERLLDAASPARLPPPLAEARGLIVGWTAGHAGTLRDPVARVWKRFRDIEPPWEIPLK